MKPDTVIRYIRRIEYVPVESNDASKITRELNSSVDNGGGCFEERYFEEGRLFAKKTTVLREEWQKCTNCGKFGDDGVLLDYCGYCGAKVEQC